MASAAFMWRTEQGESVLGRLSLTDVSHVWRYDYSAPCFSHSVMQVTVEMSQGLGEWFQRKWDRES